MTQCADHSRCIHDAIEKAQRVCQLRNTRLTSIRRKVYELIWQDHHPTKAYDLLERYKLEHKSAQAPTVYRALNFLLDMGLIHKLNSLNAYVGCTHPNDHHVALFMICRNCNFVVETSNDKLAQELITQTRDQEFKSESITLEVSGLCQSCQNT